MKKLAALSSVCSLVGCATVGVNVTEGQADNFVKGVTTQQEIVAELGPPSVQTKMPDGSVTLVYSYAEARVSPASFIPFVGVFAGSTDTKSNSVSFTIDPSGKYVDYMTTQSAMTVNSFGQTTNRTGVSPSDDSIENNVSGS